MADAIERFPLFPLGLVLLPGELVPLHIFEDRYKQMIDECLAEQGEFGIVWLSDDGLKEVGCSAAVANVIERLDDGRLNILVRGSQRFRLLRRVEGLPYPAGDIEPLEDADDEEVDPEVAAAARERYSELVDRATDSPPAEDELSDMDAFDMAATVDFPLEEKQGLLELHSEQERLAAVGNLLAKAMERLDRAEEVNERARSNGRVRF